MSQDSAHETKSDLLGGLWTPGSKNHRVHSVLFFARIFTPQIKVSDIGIQTRSLQDHDRRLNYEFDPSHSRIVVDLPATIGGPRNVTRYSMPGSPHRILPLALWLAGGARGAGARLDAFPLRRV